MTPQRHLLFLVLSFLFGFSISSSGAPAPDGIVIDAKKLERDMDAGIARLEDGVQLVFHGQHLSCDRAEINFKKQTLKAEGHVIIYNERMHIEGDRVELNYKNNVGFIYNGFVQSGQVVFEGTVIEKVAENHFLASEANYTACETCPPGWSFSGRNIDAEIGGYARIKRPVFKIAGVPILILPSIIVPLKSARQSGFLVPSMDTTGKGGLAVGINYFWAINRSQDLQLTLMGYELRGYKTLTDYRYVLSENSRGRMQSAWIADRVFQTEMKTPKILDRWFINYSHHYELPGGYVQRANIVSTSDLRYPRDFTNELKGHGDPALEKKASLTKMSDTQYASAEVDIYTNMLKGYPLSDNEDAVHRFPQLRYSLRETQLFENGPYFGVNTDLTNFARNTSGYDDLRLSSDGEFKEPAAQGPNGEIVHDGTFDPSTDIYRTGWRMDLRPTLYYPFQVAKRFEVLPVISFRETQYQFTAVPDRGRFNSTAARRYLETELRARTEFSRVFGDKNNPQAERWKHSIEPEIGYVHIPWMRTPNHPFFGSFRGLKYTRQYDTISDADTATPTQTGLQFDYEDRTFEKQYLDLVLTNRVTRKRFRNGAPEYQTAALFRLSESYDIKAANSPLNHPWSSLLAILDVRLDHFDTFTTASYNPYAKVTNTYSRLRFKRDDRNFLQFSYSRAFILNEQDEVVPNKETRNFGVGGGIVMKYLDAVTEVAYSDLTHDIGSWAYTVHIHPPGHCWMITIDHKQVTGGDRITHAFASFEFGGKS